MKKKMIYTMLITSALILNAMPCYASGGGVKISISSSASDYTSLPDAETLKKDVGFSPKLTGTLADSIPVFISRITHRFGAGWIEI